MAEDINPNLIVQLIRRAETRLPEDVTGALKAAFRRERGVARLQIRNILENVKVAESEGIPMCQDTGAPVFYVRIGRGSDYRKIREAIAEGTRKATRVIPLRQNIVDPLTRRNTGDNTGEGMPAVHAEFHDGDYTEIAVLMKGAGSENMSRLGMLNPADGITGIVEFVVKAVYEAGARPCPPTILGIGLGGTADDAMQLAKKALLGRIDIRNEDPGLAKLEQDILKRVNRLGIGPMGLGGKTTALGVNILKAGCHTASLPVGVNIQCWANRRAAVRIRRGKVRWL
ncbi:MAG: fumarate hydratase [Candidatus Altiarchaeota archaeon]